MSNRGFIVITGASTGIGRSAGVALLREGFSVFGSVRKEKDAAVIESDGMIPLMFDVTDDDAVKNSVAVVAEKVGDQGLKGLVNNAGIAVGGPLETISLDEVRWQFDVNVIGLLRTTQAFLPMLRTAKGRIVNVGSLAGRLSNPFLAPYSASKHAVEAITDALRIELVRWGIDVAVIEPGAIKTDIWGKGEDTADAVASNLTDEGRALYGDIIPKAKRAIAATSARAVSTDATDKAILHALTARRPKPRYPVGRDARIGLLARSILPTRTVDKIVGKAMGFSKPLS